MHSSIVAAQRNLRGGLRGEADAETTGADNLETLRLVKACYESIATGAVVRIKAAKKASPR